MDATRGRHAMTRLFLFAYKCMLMHQFNFINDFRASKNCGQASRMSGLLAQMPGGQVPSGESGQKP